MDYCEDVLSSPKRKVIRENNHIRRIRFSTTMESTAMPDDSIKVFVRIKPGSQEGEFLEFDSTSVKYKDTDKRGCVKIMKFSFHHVFKPNTCQSELFRSTVDNAVTQLIEGKDTLLFAYGTSSSGKTFTMLGTNSEPGILPRCTMQLFVYLDELIDESPLCPDQGCDIRMMSAERFQLMLEVKDYISFVVQDSGENPSQSTFSLDDNALMDLVNKLCAELKQNSINLTDDLKYSVWISYLEVYNENIYDLLDISDDRKPLKIGYDSKKNNYVKDLTHINVKSWADLWKVFIFGRGLLHTNTTCLNKSSSRSHSVFTIKLLRISNQGITTCSSLSICDLAGCERQKKALNDGEKLKESRSINTSLMILNRCFSAVRENKVNSVKKIPPYRDSKLTLIFQKAFSYGEQMVMFVNISQSIALAEETKNVLKMASVAQEMVKNISKIQKVFLKPQSRFSIMCSNPLAPFACGNVDGYSGIMTLSVTASSSSNTAMEETIKSYEAKVKVLEDEIKKKDDDNKILLETLEDARTEFLNLEDKYKESQRNLSEEEIAYEDLEHDFNDFQMFHDVKMNIFKQCEINLEKTKEDYSKEVLKSKSLMEEVDHLKNELKKAEEARLVEAEQLEQLKSENEKLTETVRKARLVEAERVEQLKSENEKLTETMQKLQEDWAKFQLTQSTTKPTKGRALLSSVVHLDVPAVSPDPTRNGVLGTSVQKDFVPKSTGKPPRSTKKGRKLAFNDNEFEELSGRSVHRSTRSTNNRTNLFD